MFFTQTLILYAVIILSFWHSRIFWVILTSFVEVYCSQMTIDLVKESYANFSFSLVLIFSIFFYLWALKAAVGTDISLRILYILTYSQKYGLSLFTIKNAKTFCTNSFVLTHSSAKKIYNKQLTKSLMQCYHIDCDVILSLLS